MNNQHPLHDSTTPADAVVVMTYRAHYWFLPEILLFVCAVILPLSVHAGVLNVLFDTVEAQSSESDPLYEVGVDEVPLLRAAINPDPDPVKATNEILIEDGMLVPSGDIDGKSDSLNTNTANGEISTYIVREGDTLSEIATMFGVSAKTILWANDLKSASAIAPGDSLIILPITGVRHVVKNGDTIKSIAKKYEGDVADILAYNQLEAEEDVVVGDTIIIPNGTIVAAEPSKSAKKKSTAKGGGSVGFTNPLPGSIKTQGIHGYNGVDLSGVGIGSPVVAAAAGEVIIAKSSGWNGGYGSYVVVKHPNGTQTLYAHLSSVSVSTGSSVSQGQKLGGMGNTGKSTGPHLHFEVRGARNPF